MSAFEIIARAGTGLEQVAFARGFNFADAKIEVIPQKAEIVCVRFDVGSVDDVVALGMQLRELGGAIMAQAYASRLDDEPLEDSAA